MLFATLGKLDLITVLVLLGAAILPKQLLFYASCYMLIKGALFILLSRDFASYGDFFSGVYLALLANSIKIPFVHEIVFFYLLQKTILTFVAIALQTIVLYYEHKNELPSFLR